LITLSAISLFSIAATASVNWSAVLAQSTLFPVGEERIGQGGNFFSVLEMRARSFRTDINFKATPRVN
jgi:hypothetical protein